MPSIAYVQSHAMPINMVAKLGPSQVIYAPTPRTHTLQITPAAQPVYPAPPIWQGRPGQGRPQRPQRNYTPLVEPLSAVFSKVMSLLRLPKVRPPPSPLPHWYHTNLYCSFHRATGHSTDSYYTLRNAIQDLINYRVIIIDTQAAASTPVPPPASGPTPQHLNIVNQPLPPHSSSGGTEPSRVHCIFPS